MLTLISLPSNLRLSYLYDDKRADLSNWTAMVINTEGKLTIETKDGLIKPKSAKKLFDYLSKYSVIFTYCHPGKLDGIFRLLGEQELTKLALFGKTEVEGHFIRRYSTSVILNHTPVYNLIGFTKKYSGETYEDINRLVNRILQSRNNVGIEIYNLSSGASEARSLMLQDELVRNEILFSRKLGISNIDKFNSSCYGGRMESSGLGTSWQYHYDLIKAHLKILSEYPGISDTTWLKGMPISENALPISIYQIKAKVNKKFRYNPLPARVEGRICYPKGEITGWYFKDYIDLLKWLKIPFRVLDSLQFFGDGTYPFKELCGYIRGICKIFEKNYPELEAKHFYATLAGSTKAIYRSLSRDKDEIQIAIRSFDPIIYGFVLSRQNTKLFRDTIENNAEGIKIDSIGCKEKAILGEEYKLSDYGSSTYLTPALKSLPHNERDIYREAIIRCRNLDHIIIELNSWNGLDSMMSDSIFGAGVPDVDLGEKFKKVFKIKPSHGNRTGKPIKRVGDLLDFWFPSTPNNSGVVENYSLLKLETMKEKFG